MTSSGNGADRSSWQRIDDICDRFETEKRDGGDPQIGDFLEEATSPDERETLLRELLPLDIELSGELGQSATLKKYLEQLPEHDQLIRTSFDRHQTRAHRRSSTSTSTEPQLTPGQEFGSYTIESKIGEGGMGHVYHARHVTMDRDVALKVLTPKLMDSPDAVARFHREIKAAAKLQHPNIVTAFDAGEQDGLHFLVMEFVDGRDLSSYVKSKGPLSLKQAIKCTMQAAKGLAYAHKQNIVHRDIKPANLLVDREGTVKVLDMGLARFEIESENHELTDLTGTGMVMGTIDYMAPEQSLDTKTADARSDIYSLGCTFWYLLTGKSVYGGDTVMKKLLAHREDEIPSLRELSAKVPESVDEVFHKLVAKDKDDRFQSMDEVIAALQGCLQGRKPSDSSSDMSMAADPKLASFLKDLDAPKATSPNMEYEESKSHTAAEQATVIGEAGSSTRKPKPAAFATGKLPKWVYGVAAGIVALIVAALLIPGRNDPPKEQDDFVASEVNVPTQPAKNEDEPDLPPGVTEDFSNMMTLELKNLGDHISFPTFPQNIEAPVTIECWFEPFDQPPQSQLLFISGVMFNYKDVEQGWYPWMFISPTDSITQKPLIPVKANQLTHFSVVIDKNRLDCYINGFSQGDKYHYVVDTKSGKAIKADYPESFNMFQRGANRFIIGQPTNEHKVQSAHGRLFELRVSNTTRYNGDFTPQKRFTPDENTVALYHFDQGSGNTLRDYSGNGYHGVIEGAEWVRLGEESSESAPLKGNYALSFDGRDDDVEISTLKVKGDQPSTIEARVRILPRVGESEASQCILNTDGRIFEHLMTEQDETLWGGGAYNTSNQKLGRKLLSGKDLVDLALVCDAQNIVFFVDGKRVTKDLMMWSHETGTQSLNDQVKRFPLKDGKWVLLGSWFEGQEPFFHGLIDEVRISNTARYTKDYTPTDRFEADEHTLALYHFDEAQGDVLKDSSGNGHHGKIHGATWVRVDRDLNVLDELNAGEGTLAHLTALHFQKDSKAVDVPNLLPAPPDSFTFEAWVKPDPEYAGSHGKIIHGRYYNLREWDGRWHFSALAATPEERKQSHWDNNVAIKPLDPIELGQWQHVAGVKDGEEMRLYVDGEFKGAEKITRPVYADGEFFQLGGYPEFIGEISGVRISANARYTKNFTPKKLFTTDEHTIALYHFDEGSGDILKDSSGNGHHGTIKGGEWGPLGESLTENTADPWTAEREVAEWVIERGGRVSVSNTNGGGKIHIRDLSDLPDEKFYVRIVELGHTGELHPEDVTRLARLKGVCTLNLLGTNTDMAGLQKITSAKRVCDLTISANNQIRSSALTSLRCAEQLTELRMTSEQIDDNWRFLSSTPRLRKMSIGGNGYENLIHLGNYKQLRSLSIPDQVGLTSDFLNQIQTMNPLLRLIVTPGGQATDSSVHGTDPWIAPVQKMISSGVRIQGLLHGGEAWDSSQDSIWEGSNFLETIEAISFPDRYEFERLNLTPLSELHFECGHRIIADGTLNADLLAETLSDWRCLHLSLQESDLTDQGLQQLSRIPDLIIVKLNRTKVSKSGIMEFKRKRPFVIITSDYGSFPPTYPLEQEVSRTPDRTSSLAAEREVAEWVIDQGGEVAVQPFDGELIQLTNDVRDLPKKPFLLYAIRAEGNKFSSQEFGVEISRLADLTILYLNSSSIESESLNGVSHLSGLTIHDTKITSSQLSSLPLATSLNDLQIRTHQVDDDWQFLGSYPRLRNLSIYGTLLPHVQEIGSHSQLRLLRIDGHQTITDELVGRFQQQNPSLRILSWKGTSGRIHGADPWLEPVDKLIELGVRFKGKYFTGEDSNIEAVQLWTPDRPLRYISQIALPPGFQCDEQSLQRLNSLNSTTFGFIAKGVSNTDQLARALSDWSCPAIHLDDSDLSDAGLSTLASIPNLGKLWLSGTSVSEEGIKHFKRTRPFVHIYSDFGEFPPVYPTESSLSSQE